MSGKTEAAPRSKVAFVGSELALLSFGSGCMDILSYRELGAVFTSAMTGNTALLGLEVGQGNVLAITRNSVALVAFLGGLVWGAAMLRREQGKPGWSGAITRALTVEFMLLLGFVVIWVWGGGPAAEPTRYWLISLSALAMGIQSAAAHTIGVPGITTTYFTGTLTNVIVGAVARTVRGREPPKPGRKKMRWPVAAFFAYVAGASVTGFLASRPTMPALVLVALPALVVLGVLVAAVWDARRD